jgi:predicted ATPase
MSRTLLFYVLTKTDGNLVFLRVFTQGLLENVRIIRESDMTFLAFASTKDTEHLLYHVRDYLTVNT